MSGIDDKVKYVAGFLFNDERTSVALIHKTHGPACAVGRWNAIGGRIKHGEPGLPDESSSAAMWREFQEEAGVAVNWTLFLQLKGPGWRSVDFYHAFSSYALSRVRTRTREVVSIFHVNALPETVPNLRWIIPMALGHEDDFVWVYEVTEKETFARRAVAPKAKRQMSPEQMKEAILLLAKPLDNFMQEQGIASFYIESPGTFDISGTRLPLPP